MGLRKTHTKCDPEKDYTYTQILEYGVGIDLDMLEDMADNGSKKTKTNLLKVMWIFGAPSDSLWASSVIILDKLVDRSCSKCGCGGKGDEDHYADGEIQDKKYWFCYECECKSRLRRKF